jgi:hypothetical protein
MPDLSDSTPSSPLPAANSTVTDWERYEGFRQTFLIHFPTEDQEAFQHLAHYLFDTALEKPTARPVLGPWTAWELRAGLAEMRFLEGYFCSIMREKEVSSLPKSVEKLCSYAAGAAAGIAEVSLTLEQELNRWQRKHPHGSR